MTKLYAADYLDNLPTLCEGHMDDLKVDTGDMRVWLSRMTIADGAPFNNGVTIERLIDGRWVEVDCYAG